MTNKRKEIFNTQTEYYVNIDHYFTNLTRRQVAFICLIDKLNKANIIATNKEISAYLGITIDGSGVTKMINRINEKFPKLIKVDFNTSINHLGKIMSTDKDCYSVGRNITLARELHIKGNTYVNIPAFALSKRSCFMSTNEIRVLGFIKSMPEKQFTGLLRVISKKLGLSLEIVKRAVKKLVSINAIFKRFSHIKHKLKNIHYTINKLVLNQTWKYDEQENDQATHVREQIPKASNKEDSWDEILEVLGGSL